MYDEALAEYEKNKSKTESESHQVVNRLMFNCLKERQLTRMKQLLI